MSVDPSGPTLITFLKRALARCITHKKRLATKAVASHRLYPRGESNPYLKFRKLPFYPLNYRGSRCPMPGTSSANLQTLLQSSKHCPKFECDFDGATWLWRDASTPAYHIRHCFRFSTSVTRKGQKWLKAHFFAILSKKIGKIYCQLKNNAYLCIRNRKANTK